MAWLMHSKWKLKKIIKEVKKYLNKISTIALATILTVAFVATVFAQAKPEAKPAPGPAASEKKVATKTFKGELVRIDSATKMIIAKDGRGEITFEGSGVKKLVEFKAGERIMVIYSEQDGKNVAKTIVKQATKKEVPKKEGANQAPPPKAEPAKPAEPEKK
jgi:hypothetical protein